MSSVVILEAVELIPVVELEPGYFSTQGRKSPAGSLQDDLEDWSRYWSDSVADSGITGLRPLQPGSWHVPTAGFDDLANLQRFLEVTFRRWGGVDVLSDPDCKPVLDGGLALLQPDGGVLIEPQCCADVGGLNDWAAAAAYRGALWTMLWIGHPWLSVRYQAPWVILSDLHESDDPCDQWAAFPNELYRAVNQAKAELERFADQIACLLPSLGYPADPVIMARRLTGLIE